MPVLIALCFVGAAGLYHGVEEPARRRLVRLWGGRRAVDTSPPAEPAVAIPTEEAVTARWGTTLPAVSGRPWPLDAPPRPRTVPADLTTGARLVAGDGRGARWRG